MTTPLEMMPDWDEDGEKEKAPVQSVEEQKRILFGIARDQKRRIRKETNLKETKKNSPMKR